MKDDFLPLFRLTLAVLVAGSASAIAAVAMTAVYEAGAIA
jgi:hypothetical protein